MAMAATDIRNVERSIDRPHRVDLPDLTRIGTWLCSRLSKKFTQVNSAQIVSWLRGLTDNKDYLFLATEKSVCLAMLVRAPLESDAVVQEIFVLAMPGAEDQAVILYGELRRWAENIRAKEIIVDQFTDLSPKQIAEVMGKPVTRQTSVVRMSYK